MIKKKVTILLEFGIPPYRDFLFEYVNSVTDNFLVVHNGEKFPFSKKEYNAVLCESFNLSRFKFYLGIDRYLKNSDVIIASFNFWRPSCWLPILFSNKKKVLWGHIQGSHENIISIFFKKVCIRKADYILSYTDKGKAYAIDKLGADAGKVLVVRNTLYISNSQYSEHVKKYFLYVGRIQKRKNLTKFIYAIKDIDYNGEIFRIVGDGDYKAELVSLVNKLGLKQKVTFYDGTFNDDTLREHFQSALAYVSPSQIGLGVVHSFAYGIPVFLDSAEKHGPEYEYCTEANSFIYCGDSELSQTVKFVLADKKISYLKGRNAYEYYKTHLTVDNMKSVFFKAIYD